MSLLTIFVTDEVDLWFGRLSWSWSTDLDIRSGFSFLAENVDQGLLFPLFGEDDFSLLLEVVGWSFYEDDVYVFVLVSGNSDDSRLTVNGLFWGRMDISVQKGKMMNEIVVCSLFSFSFVVCIYT